MAPCAVEGDEIRVNPIVTRRTQFAAGQLIRLLGVANSKDRAARQVHYPIPPRFQGPLAYDGAVHRGRGIWIQIDAPAVVWQLTLARSAISGYLCSKAASFLKRISN